MHGRQNRLRDVAGPPVNPPPRPWSATETATWNSSCTAITQMAVESGECLAAFEMRLLMY